MSERIRPHHLERKAILYIRQSTPEQVAHNLESQRLQYAMQARLRDFGWREIEITDDDLGRSAGGTAVRPGFERMLAQVCLGQVGAVAARELSRFARNNREWAQLVEICTIVDTLLIDEDSVYDPREGNDRLLLGVKGTLSEYELDLLRHRAQAGRLAKAQRGELYTALPAGYLVGEDGRLCKDPDRRVQHAIALVFEKFLEIGSARQVLLWLLEQAVLLPVSPRGSRGVGAWRLATYGIVVRTLRNQIYAGRYAYGRRKIFKRVGNDGRIVKSQRKQPNRKCDILIANHHEGYVSEAVFDRIQKTLDQNAPKMNCAGAPKLGAALLSGLLRCRRCGRKLRTTYVGKPLAPRYLCDQARTNDGRYFCLGFTGRTVDHAVACEILRIVEPAAIEAAAQAANQAHTQQSQIVEALRLELEGARYEAERARRQYDRVEPENRLVASELELRWNTSLQRVTRIETRLRTVVEQAGAAPSADLHALQHISKDLPRLWHAVDTDIRLKKRIAQTLIEEILVDVNADTAMVELVIHWKGGVHTELRVRRRKRGEHGCGTAKDTVTVIEMLARVCDDERIALFLNRNGQLTGTGKPWSKDRVCSLRKSRGIHAFSREGQTEAGWMKLGQAAAYLGVASATLRQEIDGGRIDALHPLPDGPWIINRNVLDRPEIRARFAGMQHRRGRPASASKSDLTLMIPGI